MNNVKNLRTFPGNRIIGHAVIVGIVWLLLLLLNNNIDPVSYTQRTLLTNREGEN